MPKQQKSNSAVAECIDKHGADVKVIGVDVFSESAKMLEEGNINTLIFQNQKQQAIEVIGAVVSEFRGLAVDEEILVKPELVMQSNLSFYTNIKESRRIRCKHL